MKSTIRKKLEAQLLLAMKYNPRVRFATINTRPQCSFLLIEDGLYSYHFSENSFTAGNGKIVFLPKGARYTYEVLSEEAHCYQLEFELRDFPPTVNVPTVVPAEDGLAEAIINTVLYFGKRNTKATCLCESAFYRTCASVPLQKNEFKKAIDVIQPAVDYFETHCTQTTDIKHVAQLCFMSESNLRRCFQREIGMSPLAYKNKLRIEKGKELILYSDLNFTQIAQLLGFNNVYEFSASFKKQVGVTPTQFLKNKVNS